MREIQRCGGIDLSFVIVQHADERADHLPEWRAGDGKGGGWGGGERGGGGEFDGLSSARMTQSNISMQRAKAAHMSPVVQGEHGGQLLDAKLLCQLRQRVDVDFCEPDGAFERENVLLQQLKMWMVRMEVWW